MVDLYVNGAPVSVPAGTTVLQACEVSGAEVPRFCYHPRLFVAGNCRMCLVEVVNSPKPVVACAIPVGQGINVLTDSPQVHKAREGVMELLRLNHPLDCPICDQAGECDLQDQAMYYGTDIARSTSPRRGVDDKDISPVVAAIMTRCIHCTRCVRFSTQVQGKKSMGTSGRSNEIEIGIYALEAPDTSGNPYMDGNIVDLCPVGALTDKLQQFETRSWEKTVSTVDMVDPSDSLGSWVNGYSIGEGSYGKPRQCDPINQEWLPNKSRYVFKGMTPSPKYNEFNLGTPMSEGSVMGRDFGEATRGFNGLISTHSGIHIYSNLLPSGTPEDYTIMPFEVIQKSDLILLHEVNPEIESPILDSVIFREWVEDKTTVVNLSPEASKSCANMVNRSADSQQLSTLIRTSNYPILISKGNISLDVLSGRFDAHPGAVSEAVEGRNLEYTGFDLAISNGSPMKAEFSTAFNISESDSSVISPLAYPTIGDSVQRSTFNIPGKVAFVDEPEDHTSTISNGIGINHPVWLVPSQMAQLSHTNTITVAPMGNNSYDYYSIGPWFVRNSKECQLLSIEATSGSDSIDLLCLICLIPYLV